MSDMLAHWASFDDIRVLAQLDERIDPVFRRVIDAHRTFARFGSLTFGGTRWMASTLSNARERIDDPEHAGRSERNIAFVLGGLAHQACDRVMKPVLTEAAGTDWSEMQAVMNAGPESIEARAAEVAKTQEVSAYFDAEVFREVYQDGKQEPFTALFLGEPSPQGARLEEVIRAMFQRALLSSHTIKPDFDHMDDWLDRFAERVQPLYLVVERWVEAYQRPDPGKIEEYGVRTRFYDRSDPTIEAARLLQAGRPLGDELHERVYGGGETRCAYGDILQTGLRYLHAASAFWRGETDELTAPNYVSPIAARLAAARAQ